MAKWLQINGKLLLERLEQPETEIRQRIRLGQLSLVLYCDCGDLTTAEQVVYQFVQNPSWHGGLEISSRWDRLRIFC